VLYRSADIRSFACCTVQPISEVSRAVPFSRYHKFRLLYRSADINRWDRLMTGTLELWKILQ